MMNDRELIAYYAHHGVDVRLTEDEIQNGADAVITDEISRLESKCGKDIRRDRELVVLDELLAVTDLDEPYRNYLRFLCLRLTESLPGRSLDMIRRALTNSPVLNVSTDLVEAFDRARRILESRYVSRVYPSVKEKVAELRTPSWLKPGSFEYPEGDDITIPRHLTFGIDFSLCAEYLKTLGLIPVCDVSVGTFVLRSANECSHQEYLEIFDEAVFTSLPVLNRLCTDMNNIVWIGCGTQFGLSLQSPKCKIEDGYYKGRIYGVVSASALNGGYGGLRLYGWTGRDKIGSVHGSEMVHFKRGVAFFKGKAKSASRTQMTPEMSENEKAQKYSVKLVQSFRIEHQWWLDSEKIDYKVYVDYDGGGFNYHLVVFSDLESAEGFVKRFGISDSELHVGILHVEARVEKY